MTAEQRAALEQFRAVVDPLRLRVRADAEGWPIAPGRYGQIEWYCDGVDCHSCPLPGQFALAVYSDHPRLFSRLRAIPGVRRHQTGDREARMVFPPSALAEVAGAIRARTRGRVLTSEDAKRIGGGTAYRATSQPPQPASRLEA